MATLTIESTTFVGDLDIFNGIDLPEELEDGWEPVIEVTCERCSDPTSWPGHHHGKTMCPPCARYARRGLT